MVNQANTLAVLALGDVEGRLLKEYEWFTGVHSRPFYSQQEIVPVSGNGLSRASQRRYMTSAQGLSSFSI
ncbi:hypothetical protein GCM10028809_28040 [Spirosoma gilvum]